MKDLSWKFFKSGELFQIDEVLSQFEPVLYKLRDLMSAKVPGFYYESQLTKSPPPSEKDYFLIEDILKQKKIKGEKVFKKRISKGA